MAEHHSGRASGARENAVPLANKIKGFAQSERR